MTYIHICQIKGRVWSVCIDDSFHGSSQDVVLDLGQTSA